MNKTRPGGFDFLAPSLYLGICCFPLYYRIGVDSDHLFMLLTVMCFANPFVALSLDEYTNNGEQ